MALRFRRRDGFWFSDLRLRCSMNLNLAVERGRMSGNCQSERLTQSSNPSHYTLMYHRLL